MELHANFKEMDQSEEDKKVMLKYIKNPKGFLLLAGTNGTGKSYAAQAIYNCCTPFKLPAYDHDEAIFINQSDLNTDWQANFLEKSFNLSKYKKTKLLVVDDLGTRKPTEAFMDFLYAIIDYRWRLKNELGTIITTNFNEDSMRKVFGDAFFSRIASGIVKRWDGPDRRFNEKFKGE
jgi:DNA replication protein DnaC